jgi:Holliday junction resolvasome RuvABC endonuclease subunit
MNVLIIDPANSCGYCVYNYCETSKTATINKWGFIDIEDSTQYDGDRYIYLSNKIKELIKENNIEQVGIEDYFFSNRSPQGSTLNCAYRAVIHMTCRQLNIHYDILNISLWKKFINKRSTPTKEQKAKWGKEASKKLMTQESLYLRYGIVLPNHSLSEKTNKPIKFRYDVVDAVAMAIFHASIYLHTNHISYNIPMIKNHEWKKEPKGTYDYNLEG